MGEAGRNEGRKGGRERKTVREESMRTSEHIFILIFFIIVLLRQPLQQITLFSFFILGKYPFPFLKIIHSCAVKNCEGSDILPAYKPTIWPVQLHGCWQKIEDSWVGDRGRYYSDNTRQCELHVYNNFASHRL